MSMLDKSCAVINICVGFPPNSQEAITTVQIEYQKEDQLIVVPINTAIFVDTVHGIALIGNDHVDIDSDEYMVVLKSAVANQ